MAFTNGLGDRIEDMRFRNPQSPRYEAPFPGYTSPLRGNVHQLSNQNQSANDARASLQRRFTTDATVLPTMTPIGQQRGQVAESLDLSSSTFHKVQLLEKKRLEHEMLKEQRRRFEAEMQLIDLQQRREEQEILQMAEDLGRVNTSGGHQSEPTTPPEYRESGFPSAFSRPNRFSSSSLTSPPPGLNNRVSRSGSQITSPSNELVQSRQSYVTSSKMPSKSVPGSRRNSDENQAQHIPEVVESSHRSAAAHNRYSMPATGFNSRGRFDLPDFASVMSLGQINTTGFLFGDDDEKPSSTKREQPSTTSPDVKSYLQMNATDDKFPILVRRNDYPGLLSASSAALDLALSQSPGPESQSNGWTSFARHRPSQHSLPLNTLNMQQNISQGESSPSSNLHMANASSNNPSSNDRQLNRRSMEVKFSSFGDIKTPGQTATPPNNTITPGPPKLQSSYSTNDIPTMKSTNGIGSISTTTNTHAQQHFHNHNASLGRIPPNAINNRQSRDLSGGEPKREEQVSIYQPFQSGLQGNAAPFGPPLSSAASVSSAPSTATPAGILPFSNPAYYGGYGMQMMNMGMNNIQLNHQMPMYPSQNSFNHYQSYGHFGRLQDSQARVIQQRRMQNGEENARFANIQIEQLQGEIYALCKDQHGCRYLQKKLEDRNPEHVHMIWVETNQHVVELMTDPFGNYLCQKLLEYANDEERTVLINNAAPQMVKIALNQHGTRALQKMIEFISTREQIQTIIYALKDRVVELIQDLNGNHVIQKCLNRLSAEDAQFIFDAVGGNCVVVGTHRHGCCVLQRCIDHASGNQKAELISRISADAFSLVQDPFGNYVVQYILDLNEPAFTNPLCHGFQGNIPALSKQKFSSNVIEKCLRTAESNTKTMMVEEMLNPAELEKMLRDSFANYVVQTAVSAVVIWFNCAQQLTLVLRQIDYADPEIKARLIETIRPILPAIRQTPYGRRIQLKIQGDGRLSGSSSGQITPNDVTSPGQIPLAKQITPTFHQRQLANHNQGNTMTNTSGNYGLYSSGGYGQRNGNSNGAGMVAAPVGGPTFQSQRLSSPLPPNANHVAQIMQTPNQPLLQQSFPSFGQVHQPGGFNNYF
ncbi:MAG: hypothetical protein M1827_002099 [Pycnora praestabilis]|nr:MAG: hypothetical protein M1827_002099 [Pycnora praestabilis]